MSPRISILPLIEPIKAARSATVVGGTTSAMGLPWRVTRRGFFGLVDLLEQRKAPGFEFGDRHFFHMQTSLVKIIDGGQINSQ
jgi:hypothetical protein